MFIDDRQTEGVLILVFLRMNIDVCVCLTVTALDSKVEQTEQRARFQFCLINKPQLHKYMNCTSETSFLISKILLTVKKNQVS